MEHKQIISRKEAMKAGLTRFFTGVPCRHGHVCDRYVNTSHCQVCDRIDCIKRRAKKREMYKRILKRASLHSKQTLAKPVPAPDWCAIGRSPTSIADRARQYREEYISRKSRVR